MTFQKKRRQSWSVLWRLFCCRFARWTLKTVWPSAWNTRRWPWEGEPENAAGRGAGKPCKENGAPNINWSKWPVNVVNDTKRHSPEKPYVLRMTSTWHYVKPRWKVVNGQIVHLLLSHNREGLVGGHFDHQPDIRSTLLYKSGCYHFEKCHFTVTPNRLLPNPHSGNLGCPLKSSSAFRNLIRSPCWIKFPLWELDCSRIKIRLSKW